MGWSEVVGQPVAVRLLQSAVASGRVAHAYLFSGPEGTGRRTAARVLAKALGCEAPPVPGDACDRCRHCARVDRGVHENVLVVEPRGREIRLWQVVHREESDRQGAVPLSDFLAVRPAEGARKVVIVDGAEALNPEAANSLLKSLEEPPPYAHILLLTANPAAVLPTVRSRCQTVPFAPIAPGAIEAALREEGVQAEAARLAAALAGGSLGRARALVKDGALLRRRQEVGELLAEVPRQDDAWRLARAEELDQRREELPAVLDLMVLWLRDAMVVAEGGPAPRDPAPATDPTGRILTDLVGWGRERLIRGLEAVEAARGRLDRNANPRLVLDVLLLRLGA